MGKFHSSKLAAMPEIEFVACYDKVINKARAIAEASGCGVFNNITDFMGEVEAVIVAVPTKNHLQVSLPFLESGIAVLLEKPIAPHHVGKQPKISTNIV